MVLGLVLNLVRKIHFDAVMYNIGERSQILTWYGLLVQCIGPTPLNVLVSGGRFVGSTEVEFSLPLDVLTRTFS